MNKNTKLVLLGLYGFISVLIGNIFYQYSLDINSIGGAVVITVVMIPMVIAVTRKALKGELID